MLTARLTQTPLDVRAISGAKAAGKAGEDRVLFQPLPLADEETESQRGWGAGPRSHKQWEQSWDQNPGCTESRQLPGAMLSAVCSKDTKHSDQMWVIVAPTAPNGC